MENNMVVTYCDFAGEDAYEDLIFDNSSKKENTYGGAV